jgi:hypothetical protein
MELISYSEFSKLRLRKLVPAEMEVDETPNWEWMGGMWISEGIGFTSVCRLEKTPAETGGLEISFGELPDDVLTKVLKKLRLPVRPGMPFEELVSKFGRPVKTYTFVEDRKIHDFEVGKEFPYHVSGVIHETNGLIHVAMIRMDVLKRIKDEEVR